MKIIVLTILFIISISIITCNNNSKKISENIDSITDTTRKVNFIYNSQLGGITAEKLGIKLNDTSDYELLKKQIKSDKQNLLYKYNNSENKQTVIDSVKKYLTVTLLNKILPHWYGMQWSMSGYSDIPLCGEVGCSYLVSNTLLHLGFNINRYKVGQAASLIIAQTFQLSANVTKLQGYKNDDLVKEHVLKNSPNLSGTLRFFLCVSLR